MEISNLHLKHQRSRRFFQNAWRKNPADILEISLHPQALAPAGCNVSIQVHLDLVGVNMQGVPPHLAVRHKIRLTYKNWNQLKIDISNSGHALKSLWLVKFDNLRTLPKFVSRWYKGLEVQSYLQFLAHIRIAVMSDLYIQDLFAKSQYIFVNFHNNENIYIQM